MFGGALLAAWSQILWLQPLLNWLGGPGTYPVYSVRPDLFNRLIWLMPGAIGLPIVVFTALVPAVVVARILMRARLRRDGHDAAAAADGWLSAHPWWRRTLVVFPSLSWAASCFIDNPSQLVGALQEWETVPFRVVTWVAFLISTAFAATIGVRGTGALLRAVAAPLLSDRREQRPSDDRADEDRLYFQAVAVTPEARAEILVVAVVTLVCSLLATTLPTETIVDPRAGIAALAYTLAVAAAAWEYQRASRIAVGLDGVLVTGTSRTRFFDYHQIDDAEATPAGDVVVTRAGKTVLRLQLHGDDATRRDLVIARIRANIARARSLVGSQAHRLAQSATPAEMARAARGLGDYRVATMGTEELWQIVEAPVAATEARRAAARALGSALDDDGRTRLRIAAEHCADPQARKALLRIARSTAVEEESEAEQQADADATGTGGALAREVPPPRDR